MRIALSFVLTVGLGCGLAQPAWAQTKQNAWQRLTGIFKSKNQKDESKKEPSIDARASSPIMPYEGRGVVFVEEPKALTTPQATGWAVTGAKAPVNPTAPAVQRASTPVVPPASASPPTIIEAGTPVTQPRFVASPITATPTSQPKIIESATLVTQPKIVAPPLTATPTSYPKTVAPASRLTQPQTVVLPPTPTKKTAKAPVAGRDVSRLTRQVGQACPKARNVKLTFTSPTEVTVEMDVTTAEECNRHAEQIFAIRDLDAYRVNLKFNVPQN